MNDTHMPPAVQLNLEPYEVELIVEALMIASIDWAGRPGETPKRRSDEADRLASFLEAILDGDPRK